MLTHAEVNKRFMQLDMHPTLLTLTFDGWLAWPLVKERLWLLCLSADGPSSIKSTTRWQGLQRLISGALQLSTVFIVSRRGDYALLYEKRQVPVPDGREIHPHLGAIPQSRVAHLQVVYGPSVMQAHDATLYDHGIGAVAAALAWTFRPMPDVSALAERISTVVGESFPEISRHIIRKSVSDQLARFRVRYRLFRALFMRWKIRSVIVTDPDGKVPEVAAAKSLSLPVVEVQHGMFSAREPDYSWTEIHRKSAAKLPLPDRIIVFGPIWRNELLRAGYWKAEEVIQSQSPVLAAYRSARSGRSRRQASDPLIVVFPTQAHVRTFALSFWRDVAALAIRPSFRLRIKIHPLEENDRSEYENLAREFPHLYEVVPKDVDGLQELLRADVTVGYTSLMLAEAVALGIPTIGLRCGPATEGFAAVFGFPQDVTLIEEVDTPEQLLKWLYSLNEPAELDSACRKAAASGTALFDLEGPSIESLLERF